MRTCTKCKESICGEAETGMWRETRKLLAVDHNHETGEVRKLLCQMCNVGLGAFKEDTERMKRAVSYLEALAMRPDRAFGGG